MVEITESSEWHQLRQAIKPDDEERLWRKLRLEWNYNSNHIEGNTLTYHETAMLFLYGRAEGGHPLRDYEEMKAHDVAIDQVRRIAGSEQVLGEGNVRDLNKIILKETPSLMETWTRDFRRDLARTAYPLPLFLAQSHWSFVHIHPFDDGNGRTARLITNYVLLRKNLPPMVIRSDHRDRYVGALQSSDLGQVLPLARFMLENVLWSLAVALRAAKGESIEEYGDLAKMDVFVRDRNGPEPNRSELEEKRSRNMGVELIQSDPTVMMGKPVIAGTRITVELILEKLSSGETVDEILEAHPRLTREGILAALSFAARALRADVVYPAGKPGT